MTMQVMTQSGPMQLQIPAGVMPGMQFQFQVQSAQPRNMMAQPQSMMQGGAVDINGDGVPDMMMPPQQMMAQQPKMIDIDGDGRPDMMMPPQQMMAQQPKMIDI